MQIQQIQVTLWVGKTRNYKIESKLRIPFSFFKSFSITLIPLASFTDLALKGFISPEIFI